MGYRITTYRGKPLVIPTDGKGGFKGEAARLVDRILGRSVGAGQ